MAKTIATILGVVFILVGICGFFAPHLLGTHLSTTHNLVHLISGIVYALLGVAGLALGEGPDRMFEALAPLGLHLGTADHGVHILSGVVFLVGGFLTKPVVTTAD